MRHFGLIGYPLAHSFSKRYFTDKFAREQMHNCRYDHFPLEKIEQLNSLLQIEKELVGLNVTIPHKQSVIPLLDKLDAHASSIGAVNVIDLRNGEKKGYNTDWIGFTESLKPLMQSMKINRALVLGTGGSSKAITYALQHLKIKVQLVSRENKDGAITYADLDENLMNKNQLIVNCTPLGTFPDTLGFPEIPYTLLNSKHLLFDLVYNPEVTAFMQRGHQAGAKVSNGFAMLVAQAEAAWEIWNG